ncbi:MAG: sulfonate transport system substrate-binding protein, partial [Myxococcales bacterium]|nr:sulfonate transport system substrate-binding protein [Myxococcales bacterium]
DSTINCATGGLIIREKKLLEKFLPHDGKYKDAQYEITWKNFTAGAPLTSEMVAHKLDFGAMADFPSVLNGVAFQKQGERSVFLGPLSSSPTGGGNGILVPLDSPVQSLRELKGKQISVPFGSTAHGMLLRAIHDLGWDPERDVTIVSQAPEVGGTFLKTGKIDAHAEFVPFAELFPFRGFARKIYDGSTVGVPTEHGALVTGAFADKYPELVVAFLKASLEADRLVRAEPEQYSELIQSVTGVEAEVNYMFHGPLGIQTRDFTFKPEIRKGLAVAVDTLKLLKKTDTTLDLDRWIDEHFIKQAAQELGIDYQARLKSYAKVPLTGKDARTGQAINDATLAGQIWVAGESKVRAYATPQSTLAAVSELEKQGKKLRVTFVHDRDSGLKLLASKAWFVEDGAGKKGVLAAFLTRERAEAWARSHGGGARVVDAAKLTTAALP